MAVRHGYGKVATDGLVFAYDTGDTRNSYKGEPTTNIIDGGANRANAITGVWQFGNHAGANGSEFVNEYYSPSRPNVIRVTNTNATGYTMINHRMSTVATVGTLYTYSFDYKQISYNGTWVPTFGAYGDGYKVPDSSYTNLNTTYEYIPLADGWTRFKGTYEASYAGRNVYRFNMHTGDGAGFEILFDNFQIEEKAHGTPFTESSRSNTEGLLDLTGNASIDISTMSFDSNAQMTFDGTSDYINFPAGTMPNFGTDDFAIEVVFKMTKSTSYSHFYQVKDQYHFALKMNNPDGRIYVYRTSALGSYSTISINAPTGNNYYHLVCQRNGDNIEMYLNGEYKGSKSGWGSIDIEGDTYDTIIGKFNNEYSQGDQPVTKVYNRALTATEVAQNFGHYKTRFGI